MFGCGAAEGPVPDVVGERLDVAKSVMSDAGYDTESLGGGVVGIVDESNWTLCETRPAGGATDGGTVKLIVDRTCDSAAAAVETVSGESPTAEAVATSKVKKKSKSKPARPRVTRIAVPDVTGMDISSLRTRCRPRAFTCWMKKTHPARGGCCSTTATGLSCGSHHGSERACLRDARSPSSQSRTSDEPSLFMDLSRPKLAFWVTALSAAFIGLGIGGASAADQSAIDKPESQALGSVPTPIRPLPTSSR